jgi:predicted unusual protein kinase regulating ubiquinone biosynthesis (AarF/ABC1/UbiB family)
LGLVNRNTQSGALARGFRIGKLGFSLVGSYLGYQAQNLLLGEEAQPQRRVHFQQQASRWVREELGVMKGPAMKLGQMLSMQTEILPKEALQELATLQMQAPGMHASLARAQFKSALGKYPEELFRKFDPEPFAAASLGQVHRALTLKGEKVAVKIQYPAIRSAIENDFKLLKSATLPTQLTGHVPAALLDEIQRGVLEETDYLREADNLEFFRKGLSGLTYLTIPRVYRKLTTDRVLTMSYIEGESLSDWLKRKPSRALRDLVGARLAEMCETQLRWLKVLHADHHPGNYLFQPDGSIGMVDFGCVKHISFDILELRRCYERRIWQESEAAARRFVAMVYGRSVPYKRARRILPILERLLDISRPKGSTADYVIDYRGDSRSKSELKELQKQYRLQMLQDKLINPEAAFLIRADMGLHHLLRELGAKVNVTEIIRRVSAAPPVGQREQIRSPLERLPTKSLE